MKHLMPWYILDLFLGLLNNYLVKSFKLTNLNVKNKIPWDETAEA